MSVKGKNALNCIVQVSLWFFEGVDETELEDAIDKHQPYKFIALIMKKLKIWMKNKIKKKKIRESYVSRKYEFGIEDDVHWLGKL